ncbi:MAG: ATP-dependent RecD-like DNA helicase [Verrucomicrobiota bacterium]
MPQAQQAHSRPTATASTSNPGAGERLVGEVLRIVFVSDDEQYAVLRLLDQGGREHTLVGPLGGVAAGQDLEAWGKWEKHADHGRQFRAENFRAVLPSSAEGIRRYLGSGIIPGIGPKLAERIVKQFGRETLDILDHYSARLREIDGVGKKRIQQIRESWQATADRRSVFIFLQGLGIGAGLAARLYRKYGAGAGEVVRRNPYQLADDMKGVGFRTADRIARQLGIAADDPMRLRCGAEYVVRKLTEEGHTCYPADGLIEKVAETLGVADQEARRGLRHATDNGALIPETRNNGQWVVYPADLYAAECNVATCIKALLHNPPGEHASAPTGSADYEQLNGEQQKGVANAFSYRVSVITGGPGVGKTTTVGHIVRHAKHSGMYVLLAAPTGRAAKRLTESSRLPAKTIHRMLKWDPKKGTFVYGPDRPLKCDMLIVDEVSMLDINLAQSLFSAISPDTHVVMVGDRDQLPSVGPGAVLQDLIASGILPVTHLTHIYRQGEGSRIVVNAHTVNRGQMPDLAPVSNERSADFFWIDQEDPDKVVELIAAMVCKRIPERFHVDPVRDIQVLTPMNRGPCGADRLNAVLQNRINPGNKPAFRVGERSFRAGDRIMQIVNNYDKDVFNGDLGQIRAVDAENHQFSVDYPQGTVQYEWNEADQVRLAYAVTVHKSQGSEFPVVVTPVLTQHYIMLQRNLVYTAMTRARRLLVMIGTRKAMAIAIGNNRPLTRHTRLAERLRQTQPRI